MPVISLNQPAALTLLAYERNKTYAAVFTTALIINVLSNVILAYYLEAKGTLIAIFITETFITIALWLSMRKTLINKD